MSFIDKIKQKQQEEGTAPAPKKNPFASRPNPFAQKKPSPPVVEEVKDETPVVETAAEEPVEAVQEVEVKETEPVVEATKEAEPVTEEKAEPVQETVQEEVKKPVQEETKEEEVTVDAPEVKEEVQSEEPPKEEEKPKAKRTRRAPAKKETKEVASKVEAPSEGFYTVPTSSVDSLADLLAAIRTPFVDEEWESFKEEIINDLGKVTITDDLNPGTLKVVIAELSIIREKLWVPLQEAKNDYERFTSKEPEGIIERVKRVNSIGGSNDTERRRSGVLACMNYETPVGSVNLYEALDDIRERYTFLKSAMDSVKFKSDVLITMNGALKLETSM